MNAGEKKFRSRKPPPEERKTMSPWGRKPEDRFFWSRDGARNPEKDDEKGEGKSQKA